MRACGEYAVYGAEELLIYFAIMSKRALSARHRAGGTRQSDETKPGQSGPEYENEKVSFSWRCFSCDCNYIGQCSKRWACR